MAGPGYVGPSLLTVWGFVTLLAPLAVSGIYLQGSETSYARYPVWNACKNATFSFEFKTTKSDALLMYVDDGGKFDFFQVRLFGGEVEVTLNIVDGMDAYIELQKGVRLNDGRWHKVEIRRNRMETTLIVDTVNIVKEIARGSDFYFGKLENNSHVFMGGIPVEMQVPEQMHLLAAPSVIFLPRFQGEFRNVLYGNCTCQTVRAEVIDGVGITRGAAYEEACDTSDPCREGCICISKDTEPACDCSELQCVGGTMNHYILPMDDIKGTTLQNPSGLDAIAVGNPTIFSPGILKSAIRLDDKNQYVRAAGPGHRYECFGDLDLCPDGYTMSMWINFEEMAERETVYLSNGGHTETNHGVAMLYDRGTVEFRFRRKNGQEWSTTSDNVLPGRWYHMTAAWSQANGLSMYVNGHLEDTDMSPVVKRRGNINENQNREFYIGRPNDDTRVSKRGKMSMDEFNFWSMLKTPSEIKELGPFYCYGLSMDNIRGGQVQSSSMSASLRGSVNQVPGKMGSALTLDGRRDYIEGGNQESTCLGNLDLCQYGITIAMWIRFEKLANNMYIVSTGNKGFKIFYKNGQLFAEMQQGDKRWTTSYSEIVAGQWYFLEVTWEPSRGIQMFLDMREVASESLYRSREAQDGASDLYIGRANTNMRKENYASVTIDELEMCYGDRQRLIDFNFILRGRPTTYELAMDDKIGNRISHPTLDITVYGQPRIVQGKVVGGLQLDGRRQYASLGKQQKECLGNLDKCNQGLLFGVWLKPGQLRDGMQFISTGTNGIRAWYEDGMLKVTAKTSTRVWSVETNKFNQNEWQFLEFAWNDKKGLDIYVDSRLVAESSREEVRDKSDLLGYDPEAEQFYIGRGDGSDSSALNANATYDEVEYWFGNREYLIAHGYIQRGKPTRYFFDMDVIRNRRLLHPTLRIPAEGNAQNVPGIIINAVRLDGRGQFLDIGEHNNICLGNIDRCTHGITTSMWINFQQLTDDAYYYSNGNGVKVFSKNGQIYVVLESEDGKRWEVPVPNIKTDNWYFFEHTWSPEKGLRVYVDNKLVGQDNRPASIPGRTTTTTNHVYIGRANPTDTPSGRFEHGNAIIDETEIWFSERDYLLASDYILRGNVTHFMIPFEQRRGNRVLHDYFTEITLQNQATLTEDGKIGNAVELQGTGEYVDFGDQNAECFGNLEKCRHGMTIIFHLYPKELKEDGYFLSSGPYSVWYENGLTHAKFSTPTKTWQVSTNRIQAGKWQRVDISWDMDRGLQLYVDKQQVASTLEYTSHSRRENQDTHVYLGRPGDDIYTGLYGNAIIDEMEVWYANRYYLVAWGLIVDDIAKLIIDMNVIRGDILEHPNVTIFTHGGPHNVPGVKDDAVKFDGNRQYLDVNNDIVVCRGNLENCKKGFTLRFTVQPGKLKENMYFVSSAPFDVFYKNGRINAEFRTSDSEWVVSSSELNEKAWNQIDVSWHPTDGLKLYINNNLVDSQSIAFPNRGGYDQHKRFFIGRANTNMIHEVYFDGIMDQVELWEAKRELLIIDVLDIPVEITINVDFPTETPWPSPSPVPDRKIIFEGNNWVKYVFRELPEQYQQDHFYEEFHLKFLTEEPNGLIWFSGNNQRNMHLSIRNGALVFRVEYGDGSHQEHTIRKGSGRFNDGDWHEVLITRQDRRVTINVDGRAHLIPDLTDDIQINSGSVFVGGSPDNKKLTGKVHRNFTGMIEMLIMGGSSMPNDLDLVDLYLEEPRPTYVIINGPLDPEATPQPPEDNGVTFLRPTAYLRLPRWNAPTSGKISLKFRTVEQHGLLLYNGGSLASRDFIAIEMYDGVLYFVINLGDGVNRFAFGNGVKVNDGQEHRIEVHRLGYTVLLTLDQQLVEFQINSRDNRLDLSTFFYVGGIDNADRLPWHLWTRNPKFFVGCIWDLKMNDVTQNLQSFWQDQGRVSYIAPGCFDLPFDCRQNPCVHGTCVQRWDKFECDCSDTAYTGTTCALDAPIAAFTGSDLVRVTIFPVMVTHTNDISLRFKTHKPDGLLFKTSNQFTEDFLQVSLEDGRGKLETNLGARSKVMYFCEGLNDDEWHTMYVKRRANHIEAWVDDCPPVKSSIYGEGYTLDIDQIVVGAPSKGATHSESFIGYIQNFNFNGRDIDVGTNITGITHLPIYPVTFKNNTNAFAILPTLHLGTDSGIHFIFKTKESNGLILYNSGRNQDFLAVELVRGYLHIVVEDGSGTKVVKASTNKLNDNNWHSVKIRQLEDSVLDFKVDDKSNPVTLFGPVSGVELSGNLYLGGIPQNMYDSLPALINSRKGYSGCLATLKINGRLFNILRDAVSVTKFVLKECRDATGSCMSNTCQNFGVCYEEVDTFRCDCNMTSYVGRVCTEDANGIRYSDYDEFDKGITVYEIRPPADTDEDHLAFGFMTWYPTGTLVKVDSGVAADFIHAKLEDGYVTVDYAVGDHQYSVREVRKKADDGQYHFVTFVRKGASATLRVDSFPEVPNTVIGSSNAMFNAMKWVKVGGDTDAEIPNSEIRDYFNGIIAGVYLNGFRIIDEGLRGNVYVDNRGQWIIARRPFYLPSPPPKPTPGPVVTVPPKLPGYVPANQGGGGVVWTSVVGGGDGGAGGEGSSGTGGGGSSGTGGGSSGGRGEIMIVEPGGGVVGAIAGGGPQTGQLVAAAGVAGAGLGEGARAAAIAGTMLGILVLASGIGWAVYKMKPGVIGGGGAGGGALKISSPRATSNYQLVKAVNANANFTGAGGEAMNGTAVGVAAGRTHVGTQTLVQGSGLAAYSHDFTSVTAYSASNQSSGVAGVASGTGTVTRPVQTDLVYMFYQDTYDAGTMLSNEATQTMDLADSGTQTLPLQNNNSNMYSYQDRMNYSAITSATQQSATHHSATIGHGFTPIAVDTLQGYGNHTMGGSSFQMQNMSLNQQSYATNLMAAEEIRVDCVQLSENGRYVVTGSLFGPPQIWDLRSGELLRVASGDNFSSTDLHIACDNTLLVGQVAELTQIDANDPSAANRLHNRKLQIWDFETGQPMEMGHAELCTASCMMNDGERVVLGRTDKFGGGTTIVIWDLMANEAVRKLKYDGAVGFADYISFLKLSKDNRYVIAGFQNSYDGNANYIIFDLTSDDSVEPKIIAFEASTDCTAILDNHEAVTGTRQGELIIWSMRTGKALRQMVAPASQMHRGGMAIAAAHLGEVHAVEVSADGQFLVSASSDTTLKVWSLETERHLYTLRGHTDEVWCCAISDDNDMIVSGARDCTIRLWRLLNGVPVCAFSCGVDIFTVRMSKNKKTIVALGDKYASRKLIMLQIVHTKTRSRAGSRATSPMGRATSPMGRATSPIGIPLNRRTPDPYSQY